MITLGTVIAVALLASVWGGLVWYGVLLFKEITRDTPSVGGYQPLPGPTNVKPPPRYPKPPAPPNPPPVPHTHQGELVVMKELYGHLPAPLGVVIYRHGERIENPTIAEYIEAEYNEGYSGWRIRGGLPVPVLEPRPERPKGHTCKGCGAPVQPHDRACSYCKLPR